MLMQAELAGLWFLCMSIRAGLSFLQGFIQAIIYGSIKGVTSGDTRSFYYSSYI